MSEYRREINSLLSYSVDDNILDDDNSKKDNKEKRHNSDHHDNQHRGEDNNKKNKNSDKHKEFNNPVYKIVKNYDYYDREIIYRALIKQDGLYKMIRDLNEWGGDPKKRKPTYINFCLKDIAVAAALPQAIDDVLKEKKYDLSKKDFKLFMNEILNVIRNSKNDTLLQRYNKEAIEKILKSYGDILYKLNKKKGKKLKELNLEDKAVKDIISLTAGTPDATVYQLLRYFYNNANDLNMSEKLMLKIFKICYGKDNMPNVMKCIMNERVSPLQNNPFGDIKSNKGESEMWVLIDKTLRDYLESINKKDIKKIILAYIKERKLAKKHGDDARRRFGDRRAIHPDDYPNLTRVLEDLESNDFSIIEYLR